MEDILQFSYLENLVYKNRDSVPYKFNAIGDNIFTMEGDFGKYWRYGGIEGQSFIDDNNLGFVDPSGGPFISIGNARINNRPIKKIYIKFSKIHLET
jgi:hypothetical protein